MGPQRWQPEASVYSAQRTDQSFLLYKCAEQQRLLSPASHRKQGHSVRNNRYYKLGNAVKSTDYLI